MYLALLEIDHDSCLTTLFQKSFYVIIPSFHSTWNNIRQRKILRFPAIHWDRSVYILVSSKYRTNLLPPSSRYQCRPEDCWHEESMESDHSQWVWTKCISSVLDSAPTNGDFAFLASALLSSKPSVSWPGYFTTRRNCQRYQFDTKFAGPQSRFGHGREENILWPVGNRTMISCLPACSLSPYRMSARWNGYLPNRSTHWCPYWGLP